MIAYLDIILVLGYSLEEGKAPVKLNHRVNVAIGLCDQQREITIGANTQDTVSGHLDRFKINEYLPYSGERGEGKTESKSDDSEEVCLSQGATRENVSDVWSQTASFKAKAALTDGTIRELHWWIQHLEKWNGKPVLHQVLETRCFPARLGCSLRGDSNRRIMVSGGEESVTHKLSGVPGGSTSCQGIFKESHWCSRPSENGQYYGHILYQLDGRYKSYTLSEMTCNLWSWCLERGIYLSAEHLPGIYNTTADVESRALRSSSEWELSANVLALIFN